MTMQRSAIVLLTITSLVAGGCGPVDNTIPVPPEAKAQIKTDPTAEKTARGKPATAKKAGLDD